MVIGKYFGVRCARVGVRDIKEAVASKASDEELVKLLETQFIKKNVHAITGDNSEYLYCITYVRDDEPVYTDCVDIVKYLRELIAVSTARKEVATERNAKNLQEFLKDKNCSSTFSLYLLSLGEKNMSGLFGHFSRPRAKKHGIDKGFACMWREITTFHDAMLVWGLANDPELMQLILMKALVLSETSVERALLKKKLPGKYHSISTDHLLILKRKWASKFNKISA